MARLVVFAFLLAIFTVHVSAETGDVVAKDGEVAIGSITGGHFGPGSFSIGASGSSDAQRPPDSAGAGRPGIQEKGQSAAGQPANQRPPQNDSDDKPNNYGGVPFSSAPSQRPETNPQGGKGGKGGNGGGQIIIGMITAPKDKNKPFSVDPSAFQTSDVGSNGFPVYIKGSSQKRPSIQIGSITGGTFPPGFGMINTKPDRFDNPNKPSGFNNDNSQYQSEVSQHDINSVYSSTADQQDYSKPYSGNTYEKNTGHLNGGKQTVYNLQKGGHDGYTRYPSTENQQQFSAGHGENDYGNHNGNYGYNGGGNKPVLPNAGASYNNANSGYANTNSGYDSSSENDEEPWVWGGH